MRCLYFRTLLFQVFLNDVYYICASYYILCSLFGSNEGKEKFYTFPQVDHIFKPITSKWKNISKTVGKNQAECKGGGVYNEL